MAYEVAVIPENGDDPRVATFERRDVAIGRFEVECQQAIAAEETTVQLVERRGRSMRRMATLEVGAL